MSLSIVLLNIISTILGIIVSLLALWVVLYVGASILGFLIGVAPFALVGGLISWWLFSHFWSGFIFVAVIILVFMIKDKITELRGGSSSSSSYSSDDDYSFGNSGDSHGPSVYIPPVSSGSRTDYSPSSPDCATSRQDRERYEYYKQEAEDAYRKYRCELDEARSCRDRADTYYRYAEDAFRSAREFDDEMKLSEARSDKDTAEIYVRDAESHEREADRYYDEYLNYKQRAEEYL